MLASVYLHADQPLKSGGGLLIRKARRLTGLVHRKCN